MTADDNTTPQSDNADSWDTTDESTIQQEELFLLSIIKDFDGWTTTATLETDPRLSFRHLDEYLEVLTDADEIETVDLGRTTLITLPEIDAREAIVALSDRKEKDWRKRTGDGLPRLDER